MYVPKWKLSQEICPNCGQRELVYDGSVKWRSGTRPPRELATKGSLGSSPRADFKIAHYFHCAQCGTRFYDDIDGRKLHLKLEKNKKKDAPKQPFWPPGSVGDVSARLGYDVRDLKMAGCSDDEINQVLLGRKTLEELLRSKPGSVS